MAFKEIIATDLRIGLYIKLEGSWFSHPFPTNTFKITSYKELDTLLGLTKVKILYDPDKSDPEEVKEEDSSNVQASATGPTEAEIAEQDALVQHKIETAAGTIATIKSNCEKSRRITRMSCAKERSCCRT